MDFNQIREQLLGADLNRGLQVRVGVRSLDERRWHAFGFVALGFEKTQQ